MFREQHHIFKRLNNLADAIVTAASFILAYQVRNNLATAPGLEELGRLADFEYYSAIFLISCILWPFFMNLNGLYPSYPRRRFLSDANIIFKSSGEATVLLIAISYLFQLAEISRLLIIGFAVTNFTLLLGKGLLIKIYQAYLRSRGKNLRRVILIGDPDRMTRLISAAGQNPQLGIKLIGVIESRDAADAPPLIHGLPLLGHISKIKDIIHRTPADQVIFTIDRRALPEIEEAMFICEEEGMETWLAPDFLEMNLARLEIESIDGVSFLVFRTAPPLGWQLVIKYFLDFAFAAIFLIILSPLMLVVAAAIWIGSGGKALYIQNRIGLHGQPFRLYKFRTMAGGERVTAIGRFLRKSGIDELPQLINILKGEMSFVGPRPHVKSEVALYAHDWQRRRLSMKPGLTCYRQISQSGKVTFDMAMELDLNYIDNWSLARDISIVLKTVPLILSRFGRKRAG